MHKMSDEEIDRVVDKAMKNTSIPLTEPFTDSGTPLNEDVYRERLLRNGPGLADEMIKLVECHKCSIHCKRKTKC